MIIPRIKMFSGGQVSSQDLQMEQMRMQRELLKVQKQKDALRSAELRNRQRAITAQQKMENSKDEQLGKNIIKMRKSAQGNGNDSLYKVKSVPTPPVPMKI